MDVVITHRSAFACLVFFLGLTACDKKSAPIEQTFPDPGKKSECSSSALSNRFIVHWKDGSMSIESAKNRDSFIREILEPNLSDIEFAEHDYVVHMPEPSETPVEPATAAIDNWGQDRVQASAVWAQGITGQGVIVAVIDSGADVSHIQLRSQLAINPNEIPDNGIDDDGNGLVDDVAGFDFEEERMSGKVFDTSPVGHGTHVSGVILAEHLDEDGSVKGIAPGSKLLPLNFMKASDGGNIGDAIAAMYYAASRGAKVINASWGGAPCSESLQRAIMDLESKGILFVAAAGNDGSDLDKTPRYPAAFGLSGQITVGASTRSDVLAMFSSYSYNVVDIVAPGESIWSLYPGNRLSLKSGTSMAAPFISGTAALLWSARPDATLRDIKTAILKSIDAGPYAVASRGRLNAKQALEELKKMLP